jgi:hypothetical protein
MSTLCFALGIYALRRGKAWAASSERFTLGAATLLTEESTVLPR